MDDVDDLVFFIFLYQRYLYPVDKSRAREYGFVRCARGRRKGRQKEEIANVQDTTLPEKDSKDDHPTEKEEVIIQQYIIRYNTLHRQSYNIQINNIEHIVIN